MNPNQMIYFNSLVLQRNFREDGRRSREGDRTPARQVEARRAATVKTARHDHSFRGLLGLALPGRR